EPILGDTERETSSWFGWETFLSVGVTTATFVYDMSPVSTVVDVSVGLYDTAEALAAGEYLDAGKTAAGTFFGVVAKKVKAPVKLFRGITKSGIVNRGGRFADLDKAKALGEVGHHMPQSAFNKTIGLSRSDGPAVGMTTADHALTRTYAGKGKKSMRVDAGLNPRQRLAKDIHDLRANFGRKYNKGSLEAIEYSKTLKEFQ
ncbi:hypothetical protein, partial [Vibrio cionasavignyae]|uniref:hypothetical protein n=1 Tax=Vibrio cionasavignyae TaxID=2910252 RepID=UPI003D149E16